MPGMSFCKEPFISDSNYWYSTIFLPVVIKSPFIPFDIMNINEHRLPKMRVIHCRVFSTSVELESDNFYVCVFVCSKTSGQPNEPKNDCI